MMRSWLLGGVVFALGLLALSLSGCGGGTAAGDGLSPQPRISVGGLFDYQTVAAEVLYRRDPNSGIGIRGVWEKGDPDDTLAVLAVTKFVMGDVYEAALDRIWPGDLNLKTFPARPWGELGAGMDVPDFRHFMFLVGTGIEFLPDRPIRPQLWMEYLSAGGGANLPGANEVKAMTGFLFQF
jgi:hypothetical protein